MSGATTLDSRARRSGQGRATGASTPVAVSLTLPVPPSVNALFKNVPGRGRVKSQAYKDWLAYALTHLRMQKLKPVSGRVLVVFGVERQSLEADIDNRVKAMLDAMVKAKIIDDDNMVTGFAVAWLPQANGLAHVQVMGVQPLSLNFLPSKDRATGGWFIAGAEHV